MLSCSKVIYPTQNFGRREYIRVLRAKREQLAHDLSAIPDLRYVEWGEEATWGNLFLREQVNDNLNSDKTFSQLLHLQFTRGTRQVRQQWRTSLPPSRTWFPQVPRP